MRFLRRLFGVYRDQIERANPDGAAYALLSTHVPIVWAKHWYTDETAVRRGLQPLLDHLADKPAYVFFSWAWTVEEPERIALVRTVEDEHRRAHPAHRFIHLSNTERQRDRFEEAGLRSVLCSQNCAADERVFHPLPEVQPTVDAVYDARLKGYKRHELAEGIENLAIIYQHNAQVDDAEEMVRIRARMAHARFPNLEHQGPYRNLSSAEVNRLLAEARVGLCLSAREGAMWASIQYLLAGLPVVSTASQGGRDLFFDPETTLIVDDDPGAVRDGVEEMIRRAVPRERVRAITLEEVWRHRRVLFQVVQDIYDHHSVEASFADEWPELHRHRLMNGWTRHSDAIARLRGAGW